MEATIESLQKEIQELKQKNIELEERLQKYTNSTGHKKYYEQNKETVKIKANQYLKDLASTNPEKLKEYRHRAYLKRKEKLKQQTENNILEK
jgi:hypothetical protein